jgi:hypothetical protein
MFRPVNDHCLGGHAVLESDIAPRFGDALHRTGHQHEARKMLAE